MVHCSIDTALCRPQPKVAPRTCVSASKLKIAMSARSHACLRWSKKPAPIASLATRARIIDHCEHVVFLTEAWRNDVRDSIICLAQENRLRRRPHHNAEHRRPPAPRIASAPGSSIGNSQGLMTASSSPTSSGTLSKLSRAACSMQACIAPTTLHNA